MAGRRGPARNEVDIRERVLDRTRHTAHGGGVRSFMGGGSGVDLTGPNFARRGCGGIVVHRRFWAQRGGHYQECRTPSGLYGVGSIAGNRFNFLQVNREVKHHLDCLTRILVFVIAVSVSF